MIPENHDCELLFILNDETDCRMEDCDGTVEKTHVDARVFIKDGFKVARLRYRTKCRKCGDEKIHRVAVRCKNA